MNTIALIAAAFGDAIFAHDVRQCDSDIVARAQQNIAWRYALRELNPFVIPDISYDQHNTDGSLDLYDPETGTGTMTEAYLQDRAANNASWTLAA